MAGPITGKAGKVEKGGVEIADVRSFEINRTSDNKAYNSSSTSGQTQRLSGNKDWSGSLSIYCQDGALDIGLDEGDTFTLKGYSDDDHYVEGSAIVDGVRIGVDVEEAELVGAEVTFSGNGALTVV